MKISIVTICFNAKNIIEKTFLSILSQTFKNIEFIVVDGGSTDGTLEVIDKYRENISYFVSEPDDGIYDAMNKGIKAATGEFIIFLNANDVFYNEFVLEKVAKTLVENPEVKILFGDADYISEDQETSQIVSFEKINNIFSLLLNNICHQSIFYHKSLFENYAYYSSVYEIYADWDFNLKCFVQNKISAIYLPIVISKFKLGGICSKPENKEACEKDKKILLYKYFSKYSFLIMIDNFSRKFLNSIYKFFIENPLCQKFIHLYIYQKKYKLNIKRVESQFKTHVY